jgi:hypothetical protein
MRFVADRDAQKLDSMRAKQIGAVIVLLFIAFLVVFPPLVSSGVAVALTPSTPVKAEHLMVLIREVSAHRADTLDPSGWSSVSNKSTEVDLVLMNATQMVALGSLSLGQYDTIKITLTNATAVVNGTSRVVQLESTAYTVPVSFFVRLGIDAQVMLKVSPVLVETGDALTLRLTFEAANAATGG